MFSSPTSDDLLSPFLSALCFVNESGNEWVTFLSSSFPVFFAFFILLGKKKNDLTLQIKNLKHTRSKKKKKKNEGRGGSSSQKAWINQSVCSNLPPRGDHFPFLPPSFLSCPCLGILLAKSRIPPPPLPGQTPFGGPSFPAALLGTTCDTHICKTNQVWRGQGVPAQALEAGAAAQPHAVPFPWPQGWGEPATPCNWAPAAPHGPGSNTRPSNGKCHLTLWAAGSMCRATSGSLSF